MKLSSKSEVQRGKGVERPPHGININCSEDKWTHNKILVDRIISE